MSKEPSSVPGRVWHKAGTVGTSKAQLVTSPKLARGVTIKAAAANADVVYVGGVTVTDGVGAEDGYPLAAGESLFLAVENADQIYVLGGVAAQAYSLIGI